MTGLGISLCGKFHFLQVGPCNPFEVGNGNTQNAATLQHAVAFADESFSFGFREMFKHMRVIHGIHAVIGKRNAFEDIAFHHFLMSRNHIHIDPVGVKAVAATHIQEGWFSFFSSFHTLQ